MSEWIEVETPVIWASRFPRFLEHVSFDWVGNGNEVEFVRALDNRLRPIEIDQAPVYLFFDRHTAIPTATKDAFRIIGRLRVISRELLDVLVKFDMSGAQFFEVPIYADQNGAPSGLPNHYVLNVYGSKDVFIPELSVNIEKTILLALGETKPRPDALWEPKDDVDVIALQAAAGEGPDLWRDPNLRGRLFFSDRLKQAIDASGLQTKALSFAPTRVFRKS